MSLFKSNEVEITPNAGTPLGRRGIASVTVKPLNWTKSERVDTIVRDNAFALQKEFSDKTEGIAERVQKAAEDRNRDDEKDPTFAEKVDRYSAAFPYLCYAGVRKVDGKTVSDAPEGMLANGESGHEGWLDDCSAGETRQLAGFVLSISGIVESDGDEGNDIGGSMPPSAQAN